MKVALTGATGFIGSHVLTELHEHGHEVTALVRDDAQADIVAARGATPAVVDLYDRPGGRQPAPRRGRGHPHRQSRATPPAPTWTPQWSTRRSMRSPAPASPTSRSAACGSTAPTPPSPRTRPFNAPALVAWKEPIERRVLGATDMRGVVIVSGVAYGDGGGGIPGLLLGSPRDSQAT